MQKINFEDATLVTQAKVTINGTDYEVTPATYSGGTDLDADTLNDLQDNVEASFKNTNSNSTTDGYCSKYINDNFRLKGTTLYENASGTTGEVTLSDSRANYEFIIVDFLNGSNGFSTIISKNVAYANLGGTYSNMGYGTIAFFAKLYNLSNTKLTPNTYAVYGEMQINLSYNTITAVTTDTLKITKVTGYK